MNIKKALILVLALAIMLNTITFKVDAEDISDFNKQINKLIYQISTELNMEQRLVECIYEISKKEIVYYDKLPSIYKDTTIEKYGMSLVLDGVDTKLQEAQFIESPEDIIRPSIYYVPDVLYSICYDINTLIQERTYCSRGDKQTYFNSFSADAQNYIILCEAIMEYYGERQEIVDKFIKAYELYINNHVDSIPKALNEIGVTNDICIKYITGIVNNYLIDIDYSNTYEKYEMPYTIGYTSKENMLMSAFSLVGKVRYTWAGGHGGTSTIKGINPVWKYWNELYPTDVTEVGYGTCIKPSGSWCPIHGDNEDDRCIYEDICFNYLDYLKFRAHTLGIEELLDSKYETSMIIHQDGVGAHQFDGLDCSGYASWVINQITNDFDIDSSAMYFTRQYGIESVEFGSDMLPGDIFAWTSHIVIIVGKVKDKSKAYVTLEQTPNVLKFGVVYYSSASQSDINKALEIAAEANKLIGNVDEKPHYYCMDNLGYYDVELSDDTAIIGEIKSIEETPSYDIGASDEIIEDNEDLIDESNPDTVVTARVQYIDIGRFSGKFLDKDIVVEKYNKTLDEMTAQEIIEYIITKLPVIYISGYDNYDGEMFDKKTVADNLGSSIIKD